MTFFERQTELPQPFPEAADADLHIVFRQEPGLQFGKRRIGFAHNAGTKSFVMRGKLRLGATCPGTGARLSRLLPTSQNFVDIGCADPEDGRRGISARSRIHCRYHPFAACRICAKLDYTCRHRNRSISSYNRLLSLRRKIGVSLQPFTPIPSKPSFWKRYWRIAREIGELEARLLGYLRTDINDTLARRAKLRGIKI